MEQEIIKKIRELRKEGKKINEIAEELKINRGSVIYWLLPEERRIKRIKESKENFKKKTKEERIKIYKRNSNYIKDYLNKRYKTDEEFREKKREYSRKYYLKKKGEV